MVFCVFSCVVDDLLICRTGDAQKPVLLGHFLPCALLGSIREYIRHRVVDSPQRAGYRPFVPFPYFTLSVKCCGCMQRACARGAATSCGSFQSCASRTRRRPRPRTSLCQWSGRWSSRTPLCRGILRCGVFSVDILVASRRAHRCVVKPSGAGFGADGLVAGCCGHD